MVSPREELIGRVLGWCRAREEVRAVVLFGSLAQPDARVDDQSDVDIELTFADVTPELLAGAWWRDFGEVWAAHPLDPLPVWSLVYAGGLAVDLSIVDPGRIGGMVAAGRLSRVWERGYRVLLDRDGMTRGLPAPSGAMPEPGPLTHDEFRRLADGFWVEVLRVPKYVARGELWAVKSRDWRAKTWLLRLLEWHAITVGGHRVDGHGLGRGMPGWLPPQLWAAVHGVFGRFDGADALRAFRASVEVFDRAAGEVAAAAGFEYPTQRDRLLRAHAEGLA
ncbi:aminoglycoside 6-adenylyltransferase [Dactylosporangium sp. CA-052675]|uniref:aminoglycoside 6-adenylyltransferase n=1 Tax=Dactylosporangium sp. CA-052675 TaxID=3239927 RepID=UPI003D8D342F